MKAFLRMGNDYLEDAVKYNSVAACVEAYRVVAVELDRYGQNIEASIHIADTKEELNEYPDFVLSLGPRGGVKKERT